VFSLSLFPFLYLSFLFLYQEFLAQTATTCHEQSNAITSFIFCCNSNLDQNKQRYFFTSNLVMFKDHCKHKFYLPKCLSKDTK
jgi:hypothetical protein